MKSKITSAFNKMNLRSSHHALRWSNSYEAKFGLKGHGREAIGLLNLDKDNKVLAKIYLTDYSESYFKGKLAKFLRAEGIANYGILFEDKWPESGDIINTQFDDSGMNEGEEVHLPADTKFYSYKDLPVSCNGFELGEDFEAEFLGYFTDVCIGSPYGPDTYSKFRLL